MSRQPHRWVVFGLGLAALIGPGADAQTAPPATPKVETPAPKTVVVTPEASLIQALVNNPITAPYPFRAGQKDGKLILSGRVGTKEVHDAAIRIALSFSPSIDDRIVIDTAEVGRALNRSMAAGPVAPPPSLGGTFFTGSGPLIYPPPLFGRLDDPFFGFEPPLITYPPWWPAVAARRGDPYGAPVLDPTSPIGPDPGPANSTAIPPTPTPAAAPGQTAATGDTIEMTIDPLGVAVLRGTVPTAGDRLAIGQKAARMQGVSSVINRLDVRSDSPETSAPTRPSDIPPPPPTPAVPPSPAPAIAPEPGSGPPAANPAATGKVGDDAALNRRLAENLARRPVLAGTSVRSTVRDGVAYLTGKVPTAIEAMTAFRAAQQTLGIRDVVDRLEFAVPDGQGQNPLIARGRPEDVEPYLEAQIRRQVGDQAHIDRVRVVGDRLELKGTVAHTQDRPRIEAILRSMPVLRGYTLDTTLVPE